MFEIQQQPAKLTHLNIRTEKHGEDDVRAVDLKFERVGSNKILDELVPGLRAAIFRAGQPGDQGDVFLSADGLTALAFPQIEPSVKLLGECPGYVATIEPGMGLTDPLVLTCELKKQRLEPVQGGSTKHEFTLSAYPEDEDVGRLAAALGKEVTITLAAPKPAAGDDEDSEDDGEE
jgi:hypothetical protein